MQGGDPTAQGALRPPEVDEVTEPELPAAATPAATDAAGETISDDAPAASAVAADTGAQGLAPGDAYDDLGQPVPARAFDPAVAAEMGEYGIQRPLRLVCMWCNAELPSADLDTCPHCGAALKPISDDIDIPGVTVAPVDLKKAREAAAEAVARTLARPSDAVAAPGMRPELEPPSDAVRRAMEDLAGSGRQATEEAVGAAEHAAEHAADAGDAVPSAQPADPPSVSSAASVPEDGPLGSAVDPEQALAPESVEPST